MNMMPVTTSPLLRESAMPMQRHGETFGDASESRNASFASILAAQGTPTLREPSDDAHARKAEARKAANELVASTFIVPMLSKLRETSLAEGPFAPGTAEKRFGPMLDEKLADRIVEASNFDIVEAIAERYAGISAGRSQIAESGRFERIAT